MNIVIDYADGTSETVQARLEGKVVSQGLSWLPGVLVQESSRCHFTSDFFEAPIGEGGERSGSVTPEPGDEFLGFTWRLEGSEEEDCRRKLSFWIACLGNCFDPDAAGGDYLHGGLLRLLSEQEAAAYDRDMDCWATYLDDPRAEASLLMEAAGVTAPFSPSSGPAMRRVRTCSLVHRF